MHLHEQMANLERRPISYTVIPPDAPVSEGAPNDTLDLLRRVVSKHHPPTFPTLKWGLRAMKSLKTERRQSIATFVGPPQPAGPASTSTNRAAAITAQTRTVHRTTGRTGKNTQRNTRQTNNHREQTQNYRRTSQDKTLTDTQGLKEPTYLEYSSSDFAAITKSFWLRPLIAWVDKDTLTRRQPMKRSG
jgi:hypothetical protein